MITGTCQKFKTWITYKIRQPWCNPLNWAFSNPYNNISPFILLSQLAIEVVLFWSNKTQHISQQQHSIAQQKTAWENNDDATLIPCISIPWSCINSIINIKWGVSYIVNDWKLFMNFYHSSFIDKQLKHYTYCIYCIYSIYI